MEKVWEIKDPDALLKSMKTKRVREKEPPPDDDDKDPAKAFSMSLGLWGSGQLHNHQLIKGVVFLTLMVVFFIGTFAAVLFQVPLLRYLRAHGISLSETFFGAEVLAFFVILFWQFNAGDAYHGAARDKRRPFKGVLSRTSPLLCSLLVPGWGQFLNGQQIKGSCFSSLSVLSFFSILSVPATLLAWPFLDASEHRVYSEAILAVSLVFLPFVPLVWLFAGYDAFMVSRDELLKEPLWERIKAANNRRRTNGWVEGVFSRFKPAFVLAVLLAIAGAGLYYYFPISYCVGLLEGARKDLTDKGMTVVPDLIGRVQLLIHTLR